MAYSYLKEGLDNITDKYSYPYSAVFGTDTGTTFTSGEYVGRAFTSSGNLTVTKAGRFLALLINRGSDGTTGVNSSGSFPDPGGGGRGGLITIIDGYLSVGTYAITIGTTNSSTTTSFTPTISFTTDVYTRGSGGAGANPGNIVFNTPATPATPGTDGPTLPAPFASISAGGGGGGGAIGAAATFDGSAAVGRTGGAAGSASSNGLKNAAATSYGSGGGGGRGQSGTSNPNFVGGTGGPGYFVIVSNPNLPLSDITATNNLDTYLIENGTLTLTDLLDNYFTVLYNPTTTLYNITAIPNTTVTYLNNYDSLITSLTGSGYIRLPFTVTGTGSFSCNYFNRYYTLIFYVPGTYTFNVLSSIASAQIFMSGAGGIGGKGYVIWDGSASNQYPGGGGSGGNGGLWTGQLPTGNYTIVVAASSNPSNPSTFTGPSNIPTITAPSGNIGRTYTVVYQPVPQKWSITTIAPTQPAEFSASGSGSITYSFIGGSGGLPPSTNAANSSVATFPNLASGLSIVARGGGGGGFGSTISNGSAGYLGLGQNYTISQNAPTSPYTTTSGTYGSGGGGATVGIVNASARTPIRPNSSGNSGGAGSNGICIISFPG